VNNVERIDVVSVLIVDEEQKRVLMVQNEALWSLPGGKREEGETLREAAIRETKEETGYDVEVDHVVQITERMSSDHVVFFTFRGRVVGGKMATEDPEIQRIEWRDLDEAEKLMPWYGDLLALWHSPSVYREEPGGGHTIQELTTEEDFRSAFPLIRQLRNGLTEEKYVDLLHAMRKEGYRLFGLARDGEWMALAGVGIRHNFYNGRHLFVYDLVTDSQQRSKGYGAMLLTHLESWARANGCERVELTSSVQLWMHTGFTRGKWVISVPVGYFGGT
jgi:8-oxo-dGTP diphosphatase